MGDAVDVRLLADEAYALLSAAVGVNVFDGEVSDPPRDADGRIHALATFYPSPGRRFSDRLVGVPGTLAFSFQVTCAGGDRTRALWCVSRVTDALTGKRVTVGGRDSGLIYELGDPGSLQVDHKVDPPETYTSIDFGIVV